MHIKPVTEKVLSYRGRWARAVNPGRLRQTARILGATAYESGRFDGSERGQSRVARITSEITWELDSV